MITADWLPTSQYYNEWTVLRQSAVEAAWRHQWETLRDVDARSLAVARQRSNSQVHDCIAGCLRLRLRTVRPPCIQSWPCSQWLFSVPQSEVSPSCCPLSWRWSAPGSCQGVAGGTDRRFLSILVDLTVCQKNVANALNSVVIILKNKVLFVTIPLFFMVELQNFLNAPRNYTRWQHKLNTHILSQQNVGLLYSRSVVNKLRRRVQWSVTRLRSRVQSSVRARSPSTKKLFQIIPTHMMNREIILDRKKMVRRCPL